ncbi:MAG: late competence development ComFB family protein [Cyanobacteriota bacterium]|nr:late competence development ComFB family protein [Cyanobacteriota bacterium]
MGTSNRFSTYYNVMEQLAAREVERQLRNQPSEVVRAVDSRQATTYALNRLPALYATTQEGWHWHHERAKTSLADSIAIAATRGIREAQRKSHHRSTPLPGHGTPEVVLEQLQELLGSDRLTWSNLAEVVEQALRKPEKSPLS